MKTFVKYILQKLLGLKTYLYVFALFIIVKLKWDKNEKDFFRFLELIPDGGIILDLGANIGVTSYHLSKKKPESTIFSFEPLTLNMDTLKRIKNRYKLKNVHEFQIAVGEKPGNLEMVMPVINNVPMHGLSHVIHKDNTEFNSGMKYNVPVVSLDEFKPILESQKPITALKIDVENFEYFVLKGAENLIAKHQPIIYCELWENDNRKKCIDLLNNLGYSTLILQKKELVPFEKATVEKHNFFFLPKNTKLT
ncbi:MAG TPA: FkbM family methyltransferase [Draconibacterium sp.]|nr:FkbM family methyltransferase [Draconibacterium sp.]